MKVLVRTREGSRSNVFHPISEHMKVPVRTREASRSNAFGFSFERVSHDDRTRAGCRSNAFKRGANAFGRKMRCTLCLTGTVCD